MRFAIALLVSVAALTPPASAADFAAPAGWSPAAVPASTDATHSFKQWHLGSVATVTFIRDTSLSYPDALATIHKNFTGNNIRPTTDKDLACQGKAAHVVEFATGPDGHRIVINRVLVPDGNGVETITYTRQDGTDFDNDVKKAESDYCAGS